MLGLDLLPFGDEAPMDAGPVCFYTRRRLVDGAVLSCFGIMSGLTRPRRFSRCPPVAGGTSRCFSCYLAAIDFSGKKLSTLRRARILLSRAERRLGPLSQIFREI